jgi:signal transduction histidine kinase
LLRRARAPRTTDGVDEERIEHDGLLIDVPRRAVEIRGEPVQLTYVEFELLRALATQPGRVFSRRMLLEALWKSADYRDPRTIDVHVLHLREKLEAEPRTPEYIPDRARRRLPLPATDEPGMSTLRGVGGRLALALIVVVAGVLGIVYLIVVPSYQRSLQNSELRTSSRRSGRSRSRTTRPPSWSTRAGAYADKWAPAVNARIVVYDVQNDVPLNLQPVADSADEADASDMANDSIATQAVDRKTLARGTIERSGQQYAEAAYPINGSVVLLSAPLHDQLRTVAVVRRRVLIAGGVAFGFALLIGYAGAARLASRIRRLEAAAEQIAAGNFAEPVVDASTDELGQLARAFERMRLQLLQLDRARGEFIANASHELRTPLFSLGAFLELLDDDTLDEATREEFLDQMRGQVGRLGRLATDLLALSRLDAGRLAVGREQVDLTELGADFVRELEPRAAALGQTLESGGGAPVLAQGDAARIAQIGRILVENALLHTPQGEHGAGLRPAATAAARC